LLNQIFTRWYAERKQFKKLKEKYANLYDGVKIEDEGLLESIRGANITCDTTGNNIEYDLDELKRLVEEKNVSEIIEFMKKNNLVLADNIIESVDKNYFKDQKEFYNLEQYVKKIQLNSSYGALLNTSSVFYDFRLGSSTTLSGRKVWQNLSASANKAIIGKYEANGEAQKYGDTDSVYMSLDCDAFRQTHPDFDYSRDHLVEFADDVARQINAGFPEYMKKTFHCTDEGANLQAAGREVVASRGVFVSKKRYALMKFDEDGHRLDTHGKDGKIKIMGLQVQRSDCPKLVRDMLKKMLESLLTKGSKEELMGILKKFGNTDWKKLKPWQKGTPKACNKLTSYTNQFNDSGQCSVGQVMAAINWNHLIDLYQDKKTPKILDGNKIIVCKLKKNNSLNMSSVAYPVDMTVFPKWFKQLPFDEQSMKESVVEKTVESIFGVLEWDLSLEKAMNDHGDLDGLLTFV
jgi:DNA polymerase elongation subunit (family B)